MRFGLIAVRVTHHSRRRWRRQLRPGRFVLSTRPVTGSAPVAEEGKLVFWVGGDATDVEANRPLLQCMGSKIVHLGGHGMGASMKMVINLLLGAGMASF